MAGHAGPGAPRLPSHTVGRHLRATGLFLVFMILLVGVAYPWVVTEVANAIDPILPGHSADGSLLHYPNGTVAGSSLIAQNTDRPWLFWERPSLSDYSFLNGTPSPPGATDPALRALINETVQYLERYGNRTVIANVPLEWAAPSASSLDPDLVPGAVLVQIPRVHAASNLSTSPIQELSNATLQRIVNAHITEPILPYVGDAFVNVLELDLYLLETYPR